MDKKWQEWYTSTLRPLLEYSSQEEPSPQLKTLLARDPTQVDLALLAADTDRTQEYVFESAKLPEIRGASSQLTYANQLIGEMVRQEMGYSNQDKVNCVIFADGGGLLALTPVEVAEKLAPEIEVLYPRRTTVATITADWRPVTPVMVIKEGYPPQKEAPFGGLVKWASSWLKRRKESRSQVPFIEALPHAERCRSCLTRPANHAYLSAYPDWPLCSVCQDKRAYRGRDMWFRQFQQYLDLNPAYHRAYYQGQDPFLRFDREHEQVRWTPQDLSEIGAACQSRRGYVGFIYLDGDAMGGAFLDVRTPLDYQQLSQAIGQAAREAVMSTLATLLQPAWVQPSPNREVGQMPDRSELDQQGRMRLHPFEIITIGGDDLILITPADVALPIAAMISQKFQNEVAQRLARTNLPGKLKNKSYTMSGGVVLASDHNPVRVLRDLAGELKTEAKKIRKLIGSEEGYVDFLILKSADMLDRSVEQIRQLYPYCLEVSGFRPLRLSAGPYGVSTLSKLWPILQQLKGAGFPTSQLRLLAEALLRGRKEASLFYLYQQARGKPEQFKWLAQALEIAQGSAEPEKHPRPWVDLGAEDQKCYKLLKEQYSYQTALWDLAQLYDFVPAGGS